MFEGLNFTTVTTSGRSSSNEPVSITHSITAKKNEVIFKLSCETLEKSALRYGDKVHIQFANNNTICRIIKSNSSGAVTLSQQVKGNETSAGIVRLTYKPTLPNFIDIATKHSNKQLSKVRYVNKDNMIEYNKEENAVTFELKLESSK